MPGPDRESIAAVARLIRSVQIGCEHHNTPAGAPDGTRVLCQCPASLILRVRCAYGHEGWSLCCVHCFRAARSANVFIAHCASCGIDVPWNLLSAEWLDAKQPERRD